MPQRKIKKAFCPPEVVEGNPVVDYVQHIIFGYYGKMEVAFQVNCYYQRHIRGPVDESIHVPTSRLISHHPTPSRPLP